MRNAGLKEEQAGIKIAERNINDLRYADDNTLMADVEEELKSLLMKVKDESEKVGIKFNVQKTKIMRSGPITSIQIDAEYIMRNAGLEEAQAGIKIARRNINNLRYVDNTTLMAESEEELKSLLMKVKEESEKVGLKLTIQKMKIMASECIMRNAGLDEAQAGIKIAGRNINNLRYADATTFMAEIEEELKSPLMKVRHYFAYKDAEYIMRNAGLEETQAGIKIAGRNINHLRYADDTNLMAEEKLKSLLMKVKEESEKVDL
ncbi:hypothetical protein AB1E19_015296 [Capra hircus]